MEGDEERAWDGSLVRTQAEGQPAPPVPLLLLTVWNGSEAAQDTRGKTVGCMSPREAGEHQGTTAELRLGGARGQAESGPASCCL